uniref:SCP domain-containing protein n=1 Tax=Echinococcus canadensis TaxID=519352 RepID=A0A915ET10_9CEST
MDSGMIIDTKPAIVTHKSMSKLKSARYEMISLTVESSTIACVDRRQMSQSADGVGLRKLHGCPPLRLSRSLAKAAQKYAKVMAKEGFFEHSECTDYGENLITRRGPEGVVLTGRQAALAWYSEISFYKFGKENQTNCGHFTQVVWRDTQKAGFGVARTKDGTGIYVVGRYQKPGNYLNNYCENVPPPKSGVKYIPTNEELSKFQYRHGGHTRKQEMQKMQLEVVFLQETFKKTVTNTRNLLLQQ